MADDTEESSTLAVLSKRVDFRGWKQSMLLYAMEKGDVDGIFTDDGSDAARGYQLIAALSHARRQSWKLLSGKLTGRVGRQITNPTLRDVWNTAITSASVAVPSQAQYQFALAMRAVEDACGGVEETARQRQIARTRFKVALMAFFEEQSTKGDVKAGFETYADGIRVAEQKLAHAGVNMSDEEKKEMKVSLGTILGWCMRVLEDAALLAAFNTWNGSASDWSKVWGPFVAMCIGAQMQEKHVTLIAKIYEVEPAVPVEPAASKGVNEEAPLQMSSLSETLGIHMCAPHNYFAWLAVGFLT